MDDRLYRMALALGWGSALATAALWLALARGWIVLPLN